MAYNNLLFQRVCYDWITAFGQERKGRRFFQEKIFHSLFEKKMPQAKKNVNKNKNKNKSILFRCFDYDHPNRIEPGKWKCPKCDVPVQSNMIPNDGGAAICLKCNVFFHWCAFKGEYVRNESPFHILDTPPTLEKIENLKRLNNKPVSDKKEQKKTKIEAPSSHPEKTFHDIFSYESIDSYEKDRPSFDQCTLLRDSDDMKKGKKFSNIQVTLNLHGWDEEDLIDFSVKNWTLNPNKLQE